MYSGNLDEDGSIYLLRGVIIRRFTWQLIETVEPAELIYPPIGPFTQNVGFRMYAFLCGQLTVIDPISTNRCSFDVFST